MTLRQGLFHALIVGLLAQNLTWAQSTKSSTRPAPVPFDAPRKPFKETEAGKEYLKKHRRLPELTDIHGHPVPETPLKRQKPKFERKSREKVKAKILLKPGPKVIPKKQNRNVKTTFLKMIFDFIIPSAAAYDADPNVLGLINCRPFNLPSNAGYFKAYFEDIADDTNAGYDDSSNGQARVSAICDVFEEIADIIMLNEAGGATPEIIFTKTWPADAPANGLASASPVLGSNQYSSTTYSGFLHQHIISHNDPAPGPDSIVNTNWNPSTISWSVDSSFNAGTYDFKTVMRHELLHALGFMSRLYSVVTNTNTSAIHDHWDKNLFSPQTSFFTSTFSPLLQVPVGSPSQWFINNTSVYQGRKNYVNAPLDDARPVYTPSSYIPGSSLSHFDMERLTPPNSEQYVMHPSISMGIQKGIHNHEKEVLCHLGYQVRNMGGCNLPTPLAVEDNGLINSTLTDIPFLENDMSFSGGGNYANLEIYSVQPSQPANATIYYYNDIALSNGQLVCGGQQLGSSSGAKCIKVATPNTVNIVKIFYQVIDVFSNRISEPAMILYSRCNVPNDEHVCNGNFEMQQMVSGHIAFNLYSVPFWNAANITPDIYQKVSPPGEINNWYVLPHQSSAGTANPIMVNDYTNQLNQGAFFTTSGGFAFDTPYLEAITTKFKTPLIQNQCYRLQFISTSVPENADIPSWLISSWQIQTMKLQVRLSNTDMSLPGYNAFAGPNFFTGFVIAEPVVNITNDGPSSTWQNTDLYLSPSQSMQYLALYGSLPLDARTHYPYMDNVSVKKVENSLCDANSISGIVYNDINISGSMNQGEGVLSGVTVRLYNSQGILMNEAISDNTGTYKFSALSPAQQYVVVVDQESQFQSFTEPLTNTLFNPYQYARAVPFTTGGVVTGENFGILLEGQQPILSTPIILSAIPKTRCKATDGTIDLTVSGGTAPFYYSWSNGQTIQDLSGIASGNYTVTVTDSSSPVQTAALNVTIPAVTPISISGNVTLTTTGGNIDITASGIAPLFYNWSNGTTNEDLTNVAPGSYTVIVADANKCTQSATFTVVKAQSGSCCKMKPNANPIVDCSQSLFNLGNTSIASGFMGCSQEKNSNSCYWDFSDPKCCFPGGRGCGSTPGTLCSPPSVSIAFPFTSLNVSTPGYQELYKKCMNQAEASGLMMNYNCCVTLPSSMKLSTAQKPSCDGKSGAIDLSVSGASGPFTYSWSNGATTQDLSNLAPGNYTVTVTDVSTGATASTSVNLISIGPVVITGVVTGASAQSYNNGAINITVTPGTVAYNYNWSKSGTGSWSSSNEDVLNLTVGSYTVNVVNKFGCKASKTFAVNKLFKVVPGDVLVPKEVIKKQ